MPDYRVNDKIIVRGMSKVGRIVNDDPSDTYLVVEFEKIKVLVDKKSQCIVLPKNCVVIQD